MPYQIHINYEEGDSNGSYDANLTLEHTWESKELAKQALARIREHWLWYDGEFRHAYYPEGQKPPPRPEWHEKLGGVNRYKHVIVLRVDGGVGDSIQHWQFHTPWCGHFERLKTAKVVEFEEDMEFIVP